MLGENPPGVPPHAPTFTCERDDEKKEEGDI
jgi:hypothetical protein